MSIRISFASNRGFRHFSIVFLSNIPLFDDWLRGDRPRIPCQCPCKSDSLPIQSRISNWWCRQSWELCIPLMLVTWGKRENRLFTRILNRPSLGGVAGNHRDRFLVPHRWRLSQMPTKGRIDKTSRLAHIQAFVVLNRGVLWTTCEEESGACYTETI